ncbi:tyrosinase family protein [Pseudomonas sp. SDO524_S393]
MNIRKEIRTLSAIERQDFIDALLTLKRTGGYDKYVHWYQAALLPAIHLHEPYDPHYRSAAHKGPAFLPWHRELLRQFEEALQRINPDVALPYWDWTLDASNPIDSPLWREDFLGANGDPEDQWRVQDGAFAERWGHWPVPARPDHGLPGTGLKRRFGQWISSLPTLDDVQMALGESLYDEPNYTASPFNRGFRNRLEGWVTQRGDPRVTTPGVQLHNRVHLWVGGNLSTMAAPQDPVFFLHHCFIDKIWADWQAQSLLDRPALAPHYCPMVNGPPGHNFDDVITPWKGRIRDVLEIDALGYRYAPSPNVACSPFKPPFMA